MMVGAGGALRRLRPVVVLLLLAPVCAEYLSAYLPQTGDAVVLLAGLLVLGPLYGGAAVLVHEVAARTGRGWRGILLLGAAYGVLQAGVVDLSLVTRERTDVAEWSTIVDPTAVPALGMSAYPVIAWVVGHAVLSTGAPLALVEGWYDRGPGPRRHAQHLLVGQARPVLGLQDVDGVGQGGESTVDDRTPTHPVRTHERIVAGRPDTFGGAGDAGTGGASARPPGAGQEPPGAGGLLARSAGQGSGRIARPVVSVVITDIEM